MKIFISWSGEPSQTFAQALADWLPMVIQSVKPFMSTNNIRSGQRWSNEIGKQLQENTFGIICLTPNNREAPWIHFEAGALAKFVDNSAVVPLRIGIENAEITPPLSQFQAKNLTKREMLELVLDINSRMKPNLESSVLHKTFNKFWPDLESSIISAQEAVKHGGAATASKRSPEEMTEETLNTVRSLAGSVEQMRMKLGMLSSRLPQTVGGALADMAALGLGLKTAKVETVRGLLARAVQEGASSETIERISNIELDMGGAKRKDE